MISSEDLKNKVIYLDNNATTPLAKEVINSINECLVNSWANPSSNYSEGKDTNHLIQKSRQSMADMINANTSDEIIFTSGGTEANNWIISSSLKHFLSVQMSDRKPHIITTNIEHDSIREPLEQLILSAKYSVDVTFVSVDTQTGCVSADDILEAIRAETCLITVMLANNETGVIQPVRQIGHNLIKINTKRKTDGLSKVLFHCDAAQALGKIPVDVQDLSLDYMTIVGHKFYGPRIGALYRRTGYPLLPLFFGGGQEKRLRPGTENTPMIAGLAKAAELVTKHIDDYNKHFKELQNYFETQLKTKFGKLISINCSKCPFGRLPNTTSLAFNHNSLIGSNILFLCSNLRASLGAACHSDSSKEGISSKILIASGISLHLAQRTIRLSTGRDTTKDDIDRAINELSNAANTLMSEQNNNNCDNNS